MRTSIDTCIYRFDANGEEIEIEVEIACGYSRYVPARLYGPPEDCYEAEGGCAEDVTAFFMDGKKRREISLTKEELESFEEELGQAIADAEECAYEDAMEARAEARAEMDYD